MLHNINRKPTSIDCYFKWKYSELKIFLLYESIPILMNCLPASYFAYFSTFAISIRILYEPIDDKSLLIQTKDILKNYVKELEEVYSIL